MHGNAVWSDQLRPDEHAALHPGIPDGLIRRPDVLVIGGGIIGVATAAACVAARLGSVVVLERDHLGHGATGGAGGLLVPAALAGTHSEPYAALGRASLGLWRDLEATMPGGVGLIDLDWLRLEPLAPALAASLPTSAERFTPAEVAEIVPGLAPSVGAVRVRHQARVNPLRAIGRLASAAGPNVCTGVTALGVALAGGRLRAVATTVGTFEPGALILATGTPPVLDGLPLDLPFGQLKGHIVATAPAPIELPGLVAPVATQLEGGQLMAGGTIDEGDDEPSVREDVIAAIRADLEAALPVLRGLPFKHAWSCFRPTHPDGLPVIDRVPGLENAWITSGHFRQGILMAPATGRVLAAWVASGRPPAEVAGFEATRFAVS